MEDTASVENPQCSRAGSGVPVALAAHIRTSVPPGGRCFPPPVLQRPGRQRVSLLRAMTPGWGCSSCSCTLGNCSALVPKACCVLGVCITGGLWYTDASMWGMEGGVLVRVAHAGAAHALLLEAACEVLHDVGSSSLTAP